MDFQGQKQAEQLIYQLLVAFAAAGFLAGYATGSFDVMVYVNAAGLALTMLAVVPDWPWFNRNPLSWLPPLNPDDGAAAAGGTAAGGSSGSSAGGAAVVAAGGGGRSGGGARAASGGGSAKR
jgi:signal peptidase complex subunit 1